MPDRYRTEKLPTAVYPGKKQRMRRTPAVRFAENCIQQIGVVSLRGRSQNAVIDDLTRVKLETVFDSKNSDFELFFRSERSARRVLQEIRGFTHCPKIGTDYLDVGRGINDTELVVLECARLNGIEVISRNHVDKVIQKMAKRIDDAIARMQRMGDIRAHNQEYKQERLRRIEAGAEKMPPYQEWIVSRVGTFKLDGLERELFSKMFQQNQ